jgi:hypothetical protein
VAVLIPVIADTAISSTKRADWPVLCLFPGVTLFLGVAMIGNKCTSDCSKDTSTKISRNSCTDRRGERLLFVMALQFRHPGFFRSLNDFWRNHFHDLTAELVAKWFRNHKVRDEWLCWVCIETCAWWNNEPEGPAANLLPGYFWFAFDPEKLWADDPWDRPFVFAPTFEDPSPRRADPDMVPFFKLPVAEVEARAHRAFQADESLDAFERRMTKQFRAQLKAYVKILRYRDSQRDAEMTVLRFAGKSWKEIAGPERGEELEQAARKSVERFADGIGLTLTQRRRPHLDCHRAAAGTTVGTFVGTL